MKTNPGGNIAPNNVIGRDRLIKRLWETLDNQSALLVAERRIGKTTVIRKMEAEPTENTVIKVRDIEAVSSPTEFVERVTQDVAEHLGKFHKTARQLKSFVNSLSGAELNVNALGFKFPEMAAPHWKELLEKVMADLAEDNNQKVILIWDEMPWMLQKIIKTAGEREAMDLLDTLRGLRQTYANLRMVYTGSIGLHHVITALRDEGYVSSPVNDMRHIEMPPLNMQDAKELALKLIQGEGLKCDLLDDTAECVAGLVDAVPFYIHHVIAKIADQGCVASPENAQKIVKQSIADAQDPWDLEHYRSRLGEYYGNKAELARAVLDQLAQSQPLTREQLREQLKVARQFTNDQLRATIEHDTEEFRKILKLMQRDHYLAQDEDTGAYRFRFDLIRNWWRFDGGYHGE